MFLKKFKEKLNKKILNNILNSKETLVNNDAIKSIGIILNSEEFDDQESIKTMLFETFSINENNIKFVTYVKDDKSQTLNSWDSCFTSKQIGWKGKINNVEIKNFINTKFDALINYYNQDCLELNLVSALSLAKFKIGISDNDPRLNDFVINVEAKKIDVFSTELKKYLKIFNKI